MKVTFFSSTLNHHQLSFCDALNQAPDVDFVFVQMIDLTEERRAQGFVCFDRSYVVSASKEPTRAHRLCLDSDIVIAGVVDQQWINERVASGRLTFVYKERFLKSAKAIFTPAFWKNGYQNYYRFRNQELYFLCASAYTARDTRMIFPRPEKKFKWGYFPTVETKQELSTLLLEKEPNTILWVGRFLPWKHPETSIMLARRLKKEGLSFHLNLIGLGEMRAQIEKMIADYGLGDCVHMLGQMPPERVREQMRKSEIFLTTSDRKEGWGAVLNEAMSEGCAPIASRQAGCTEFLIHDGENGYIFDCKNINRLFAHTKNLLLDGQEKKKIQEKALLTIRKEWNAEVAAQRFLDFCRSHLSNDPLPEYATGPMSISN